MSAAKPPSDEPTPVTASEFHTPLHPPEVKDARLGTRRESGLGTDPETGEMGQAIGDLARAFQANSEALQGIHEVHADLARAIKRGDRSELVLQSTGALNDTFRNLTSVQRQLLSEMEETKKTQRRSPLIPIMILGLLTVVLGGVYVVVREIQRHGTTSDEVLETSREQQVALLERYKEGKREGALEIQRQVHRLEEELTTTRGRLEVAEADRDTAQAEVGRMERSLRVAEREREEMAERAVEATRAGLARKAEQEELRRLRAQNTLAEEKVFNAQRDAAKYRELYEMLAGRLASIGMGLPVRDLAPTPDADLLGGEGDAATTPPPEGDEVATSASPGPAGAVPVGPDGRSGLGAPPRPGGAPSDPIIRNPVTGEAMNPSGRAGTPPLPAQGTTTGMRSGSDEPSPRAPGDTPIAPTPSGELPDFGQPAEVRWIRDEATLEGVQSRMNRLFRFVDPGASNWQITQLGAVSRDLLGGVALTEYDGEGRVIGSVTAAEMEVLVDRGRGVVEVIARQGMRARGGRRVAIPPGGNSIVITRNRNMVRAWRQSSLSLIKKR